MNEDFKIEKFGERIICIGGIGKSYYQDGFPIEMSILALKDKGVESSVFHIADELLKNGFPPKRVISILNDDGINSDELIKFCNSTYEEQREMIFQYLFGFTANEAMNDSEKRKILTPILEYLKP